MCVCVVPTVVRWWHSTPLTLTPSHHQHRLRDVTVSLTSSLTSHACRWDRAVTNYVLRQLMSITSRRYDRTRRWRRTHASNARLGWATLGWLDHTRRCSHAARPTRCDADRDTEINISEQSVAVHQLSTVSCSTPVQRLAHVYTYVARC